MASILTLQSDRVFSDSSVLYSAAYSDHGYANDLITAGIDGHFVLRLSPLVLFETQRNIARKAPHLLSAFQVLATVLAPFLVTPTSGAVRLASRIVHPKDAPIVAGALTARAMYVSTYERRHLLNHAEEIRGALGVLVMTPDEILRALGR
jgi:predicted nucleic acid-binding protein